MINGRRVIAVITARGGSKGLPRKALLDLGGRPVLAWSVATAHAARFVDRVVVSSDDLEIIAAARAAGGDAPFIRPPSLAQDDSSIYDALFHALDSVDEAFDYVVLLQATSPLRIAIDIESCLQICETTQAPSCVSVMTAAKSPYWMFRIDDEGQMHRLLDTAADRRQDLPPAVTLNGAVYAARIPWLRQSRTFVTDETRAYMMPPERSVDIDSRIDLLLARALLRDKGQPGEGVEP